MSDQLETPISGRGTGHGDTPLTPKSVDTPTLLKTDGIDLGRDESRVGLYGDDDVFNVQLSEVAEEKSTVSSDSRLTEDPNLVNVHQFYPVLQHQFEKNHSNSAPEQKNQSKKSIKENGGKKPSTTADEMALVPSAMSKGRPLSNQDENNSSEKQKVKHTGEKDDNNSGVFSTAVDEQVLHEAKRRQSKSIFQTEKWGMEKPIQPSMKEILDETATKHFIKAVQLKEEGNFLGVIININKALGIYGDKVKYYEERAEAYIRLCDFQSAILNYKKACLLDPSNEQYYSRLSFLYFFQGQSLFDQCLYPEALEAFSRAAEMQPENVGYHIRSITCLAALHRHGECLALVNKRLEIDKENADLYVMRARLHEMFRNTTLCYYDVKDALGISHSHPEAVKMMKKLQQIAAENRRQAVQLNLMGKHRDALQKISMAIETDPSVADFHVHRGALHRKLSDYNAAIDDFLLALDKCDHNEESPVYVESQRQLLLTYNDFAVECFTKGFFEEAIILLNKAIKGEKREKGLYVNRGDCFFRQGEYNFAMQDYEQALELDANDETITSRISVIHNEFGVAAYQDKLLSEAESRFTKAIEYHPKIGQYYISRARARYMLENMAGARGDLLMGLLLDPNNEDVISILSRLFPGKSVGDVLASRAVENAKIAISNIFRRPKPVPSTEEERSCTSEEVDDAEDNSPNTQEVENKPDTSSSDVSEPMWHPGTVSDFKIMMAEEDFNIKLVELKQGVNVKVKAALLERKTLKHDGPRIQPLPPPQPRPTYGGTRLPKEKMISPVDKHKSTNWHQFNMGIGLGGN